jgi:hypothetical protein
LITANSEEGRALLRWIEAEDPALLSATRRPPEAKSRALPKLQHIPSYLTARAPLQEAPPLVVDLRPPSAQPPGPAPTTTRPATQANLAAPTTLALSEEIETLGTPNFPATKFAATTTDQPENVRFRIGVNGRGEIQYSFPLNSSGDAALNEQAREHIARTRFTARSTSNNEPLVWGIATVQWGNDVAAPPARSTSTPAPSP